MNKKAKYKMKLDNIRNTLYLQDRLQIQWSYDLSPDYTKCVYAVIYYN